MTPSEWKREQEIQQRDQEILRRQRADAVATSRSIAYGNRMHYSVDYTVEGVGAFGTTTCNLCGRSSSDCTCSPW